MPVDPELLELARQFDHDALAQIYDSHSPGLYRYAMRLLSNPNLAEECVAETFSRFLQQLRNRGGPGDNLQAYLYRTAHNWIVDMYRKDPIQPVELTDEHEDRAAGPEERAGERMNQERLRKAIRRLTPDQQQVIALKYLEGWENEQIAVTLRKPVGAVKSLQHRALATLQRMLDDEEHP